MTPLAARYGRLWLAEVEAHLTDPEGHAPRWLEDYAPEVLSLSFGHNALRLYDPAGQAPQLAMEAYTPQHRLDLAIDGGRLWGWELPLAQYAPGDVARVALLWEKAPDGPTRVSLRNSRGQVLLERSAAASPGAAAPEGAAAWREQLDFAVAAATPAGSYDIVLDAGGEERVLGAMCVVGTRTPSARGSPEVPVGARLGPSVTLIGYTLRGSGRDGTAAPGETFTLDLYWSTAAKLERDYTVFAHLLGTAHNPRTQGPVWGQHDGQPCDGGYPTTQWLIGDAIIDRHTIPVDEAAPAGEYRLEVGLYTVEDGSRLGVCGPGGESWGDRVLLDTPVTVAPR